MLGLMVDTNRSVVIVSDRGLKGLLWEEELSLLSLRTVKSSLCRKVKLELSFEGGVGVGQRKKQRHRRQIEGTCNVYKGVGALNHFKSPEIMEEKVTEEEKSLILKDQAYGCYKSKVKALPPLSYHDPH